MINITTFKSTERQTLLGLNPSEINNSNLPYRALGGKKNILFHLRAGSGFDKLFPDLKLRFGTFLQSLEC